MPPSRRGGSQGGAASLTVPQAVARAQQACARGDWAEAEGLCRRILHAQPAQFDALYMLGIAAGRAGRSAEAAELLAQAAGINEQHADTHYNRGVALASLGRHAEALSSYARAAALNPSGADIHFNAGASFAALGQHDDAAVCYMRAIALDPGSAAHHNLGISLAQLGRLDEALEAYDRAIALKSDNPGAYNSRGATLAAMGRMNEAVGSYERAIALRPDYAVAYNNRGIALWELERAAEALASCDQAIALNPAYADAHYNRGNALRELQRYREAAQSYEHAIAIEPAHAAAHWNLADACLLLGDFERGWPEYEWRHRLAHRPGPQRELAGPPWQGEQAIGERTILLHAELGLGDTLQFCRYAAKVARLGARVVLEVQPSLVSLLSQLEGVAQVVASGDTLPPFDFHCPLMSLPLAFKSNIETIPASVPYLRADPARVAAWRARLGAQRRPRVGLAWSGSQGLRNDKRSMTLAQMLPLARNGAEYVSLQKEVSEADAAWLAWRDDIRHFGAQLRDFADTAALIELVDVVVTVDTAVAHLAGAMGKEVLVLLPCVPHDWRWLLERDDSPWYPTAQLFRQPTPRDWDSVILRVDAQLRRLLTAAAA
jgi:tetratricopeptide (TPR) repeat protein